MNQTLKQQLSKLMIETKMPWTKCLPLALSNIRTMSNSKTGISPYEMLYGMPYPKGVCIDPASVQDPCLQNFIITINKNLQELREKGILAQTVPLGFAIHKIKPGQYVLIKVWKEECLDPKWEGLYLVLLTTETAVRTAEKGWTYVSRVKGPVTPPTAGWMVTSEPGDLKVRILRTSCRYRINLSQRSPNQD
ncbi:hypothetical protein TURU_118847 [Turdus rufiventris]|nr:hypothetical protein TURU_118847 [Turdus rufiventris]